MIEKEKEKEKELAAMKVSRRKFLKTAAAGAGVLAFPTIIPSSALGLDGATAPSERIVLGVIGTGGMGGLGNWSHSYHLARKSDAKVLAVCDVQKDRVDTVKAGVDEIAGNKDCQAYGDYRELLARPDIDAVFIATPDHWHALIATDAARAGKHIYCEKPLTRTFREAQILRDVIKKSGVVFQQGTQHRSDPVIGRGCDIVQSGRLGKLLHVRVVIPSGDEVPPQPVQPVPETMNYEMWLGPAPFAPYTFRRVRSGWYSISDYCMGRLSGWGAHHIDTARQGTGDPDGPVLVDGTAIYPKDGLFDNAVHWEIRCEFENGVSWCVIDTRQDPQFVRKYRSVDGGVEFTCEKGTVFVWRDGAIVVTPPEVLRDPLRPEEISLERQLDHRQNFLDAIKTGKPVTAPIDVAVRSYTINLLCEITTRLGRPIKWDPKKEEIIGDEEASRLLWREYRAPWRLET